MKLQAITISYLWIGFPQNPTKVWNDFGTQILCYKHMKQQTAPLTVYGIGLIWSFYDKIFDRNSWRQAALPCLNPYEGLTAFVKWIDDVRKESQEIILMAHNNKFFHSDILAHNLMKLEISLPNYIHFSDSIHLMKKIKSIGRL